MRTTPARSVIVYCLGHLWLSLCWLSLCLLGTAGLLSPHLAQGQYVRFGNLTINDGLSQSTVFAIVQDQYGFMWFATQDGLNRYDGYTFTVFRHDPADPNSLPESFIRTLSKDRDGILWIGTDQGLSRFDPVRQTFQNFQHDANDASSLSHDLVTTVYEDRDGVLWVGTNGGGLNRFDRATETFTRFQHDSTDPHSLSHDAIHTLYQDRSGVLWIGTRGGGLNRLEADRSTFTRFQHRPSDPASLCSDYVYALYQDRAGTFWIGTAEGLSIYDDAQMRFTHQNLQDTPTAGLAANRINTLYQDSEDTFWVGTAYGLHQYNAETATFQRITSHVDVAGNPGTTYVHSIAEDRSGLLWIGTLGQGLLTFDHNQKGFVHYQHNPYDAFSLSNNMVWAVHAREPGTVWVGTRAGFNRLDVATDTFTRFQLPLSAGANVVLSIRETRDGLLWIGTSGQGLFRYDPATGQYTHFQHDPAIPTSLSQNDVWRLYEDQRGVLWVGTDNGLNRFDRSTESFTRFQHDPTDSTTVSNNQGWAFLEDTDGTFWIGTENGLNRFDRNTQTFSRFGDGDASAARLSSQYVRTIHRDRAGTFWVGTDNGLNRFDPATERFVIYTTAHGLPNNVIYSMLEDMTGAIWVSTNNGLAQLDPRTETFSIYDRTDGLQSNEFNGHSAVLTSDGRLYFGGINGLTAFYPDALRDNAVAPPVVLTSFKKLNQPVDLETVIYAIPELVLEPEDQMISFEFAALDYHAPERNQYRYRLAGLNDGWVELGNKHDITFTNLEPGTYLFQVQAANEDGVWNREGTTLRITVLPPFWKTWWFILVASLVFLGAILGIYSLRTHQIRTHNRQLRRVNERLNQEAAVRKVAEQTLETRNAELAAQNAQLEQFTYTVSHDLKTPLVTIKNFLGILELDIAEGKTPRMHEDLGYLNQAANTMSLLLDDMLELCKIGHVVNPPEAVSLTDVAQDALRLVQGRLTTPALTIDLAADMPIVAVDRARFVEVYQNLLDNAAKFMGDQPHPHIEIGAQEIDGEVRGFVRDNGMGIPEAYQDKIFHLFERLTPEVEGTGVGLTLVQRIVEFHEGRVWLESAEGQGSTFWFALQAAHAVPTPKAPTPETSTVP